MERQLSVGGVFSAAFSAFGARARVLVPISFCVALAAAVVNRVLGENALGVLAGFVVNMAFFAFVLAVAMAVLRDLRERRPDSSATELLSTALPPLPAATLAGSLAFAGVLVGMVLLIVPGLILMTIWAVLLPVVVAERQDVFDAFGRSQDLVRGNGWKVFGIAVLLGLILVGVSFPVALILQRQVEGAVAHLLIGSLVSSVVTPLEALVLGVLYYRLLEIKGQEPPPAQDSVLE
jgi:uncharacterized membrane protein